MNERQMVFVSLALALLGIALLFFLAETMKPKRIPVADASAENVGEYVEVFGVVRSVSERNGNVFIKLCEGQKCLSVVVFESNAKRMAALNPYLLKKGDRVLIRGIIQEYKDGLELVVNKADGMAPA